jgi:hypothetical protein
MTVPSRHLVTRFRLNAALTLPFPGGSLVFRDGFYKFTSRGPDILDAFGADTLIGPRIALKGGTALIVFHSDLDRLSVDIDVNYVGATEKESMDAGLEDRIERLMESKGYAAWRGPSEHAGGKWIYRYASALGGAGTIEIDINYLFRGPPLRRGLHGVGTDRIVPSDKCAGSRHP